ncbi:hypothetical protein D3OALGA1CA_1654 [Olavius algarvensis associated proteobacterium Delta 3]|nr:hypothetical protein D3OALGA1CA_1654 [Olavius algarvensis associated proteobacterium Delta 3]
MPSRIQYFWSFPDYSIRTIRAFFGSRIKLGKCHFFQRDTQCVP